MKKLLLALSLVFIILVGCTDDTIDSKNAANYTTYLIESLEEKSPEFVENFENALDLAGKDGDFEEMKTDMEKEIDSTLEDLNDIATDLIYETYKKTVDVALAAIDFTDQKQVIDDFVIKLKEDGGNFFENLLPSIPGL
ncbi:MAG: hypothetical protein JJV90_01285 [Spiroplasma sp.]|nr:hypothetical protein [Mycoplasmatales bacterium]